MSTATRVKIETVVERTIETVDHPRNPGSQMRGIRLQPGDVLAPTDFYSSSSGRWEQVPCPGLTLQVVAADPVWIRPHAG